MSIFEKITAHDRCVYWAPKASDRHGQVGFDDPIEMGCRWEESQEIYTNTKGEEAVSNALVYTELDVVRQGRLWHGKMEMLAHPNDPYANDGTWEIMIFKKIGNIKNRKFVRKAYL